MLESTANKILFFNLFSGIVALIGYLMHVTDSVHVIFKYLFYPLYGYVMLSFISSAIGIVMAVLDKEKGRPHAAVGIWGNALYIVAVIAALAMIWIVHHPQSIQ